MGLEFLRAKAQRFTQQRDRSKIRELDTEDLITRGKPGIVVRHFRCVLTDMTAEVHAGLGLILFVDSETHVRVLQHGRHIGHVVAEDVQELIVSMKRNDHVGGLLSVTIVEEPAMDGVFTVKPKVRFKK